ncbi:MAG: hypothetical protein KZQ94_22565 [Candidatus Thiodiazotropha sp. (ex Troendleina suluensis)]|nr:hypothetical protein [Candidatus Thiodiazotropha sp. (ex Troendleina suluensis)]
MRNAYYDEIEIAIFKTLTTKGCGVEIGPSRHGDKYSVRVSPDWIDSVNERLDQLAQAFPYARVEITGNREKAAQLQMKTLLTPYREDLQELTGLTPDTGHSTWLGFFLARNNYYGRKFVDADGQFINIASLQKKINAALHSARQYWRSTSVLKNPDKAI